MLQHIAKIVQADDLATTEWISTRWEQQIDDILLGPDHFDCVICIGVSVSPELSGQIIDFWKTNQDRFAWSH